MNKTKWVLFGAALIVAASASATPLVSYAHNYGNAAGQVAPGGEDKLFNGYVKVQDEDPQTYDRFNDHFKFGDLNFSKIDYFELTVQYANTNDRNFIFFPEHWYLRPGAADEIDLFSLKRVANKTSTTFRIDADLPQFADMVTDKDFYFWLAEDDLFDNSFKLYSATLAIYGQAAAAVPAAAVPEPAAPALFGLGLAALGLARRRKNGAGV